LNHDTYNFRKILISLSVIERDTIMSEDETKECPKCGSTMIKRENYLPDDFELTEVKTFWLCGSCMYYEVIE